MASPRHGEKESGAGSKAWWSAGGKKKCNSSRKGTIYKRERHAMQTPKHGEKTVLQVTLDESLHKNAEMLHKKE